METEFDSKVVQAHEVMIDDWIHIGEGLFRVLDTGHALMDVMALNHTVLMLRPVWTEPVEVVQLILPMKIDLVVLNQK